MNHFSARLSIVVAVLLIATLVVSPVVAQSKSVEVPRRDAGSQPPTWQSGNQLSSDHDSGSSTDWSSGSRDFGGGSSGGGRTSGFN